MNNDVKGKWLWLGCSNEKNFRKEFETEERKFELCTKLAHFETMIETAHEGYELLMITGIDNIVADIAMKGVDPAKFTDAVEDLFKQLEEQRKRGMKIAVGPLLPWKKHTKEIKCAAVDSLKEMKVSFPGIRHITRHPSLSFTKDNVHLTDRAAVNHFKCVFTALCELFFNKDDDYLTEEELDETLGLQAGDEHEFSAQRKGKKAAPKIVNNEDMDEEVDDKKHSIHNPDFKKMMQKIEELNKQMKARWSVDLVASAGTKEDLDRIDNTLNMNKVIIMGLEVPEIWDTQEKKDDWKDRIAKIKDAVANLFNFINPGVDYNLGFVRHLNAKLKAARQIVEVTLESDKKGKLIRKAYAERVKEWREKKLFPDRMAGVSITPSLTLATRVRIAMLKAFAKVMEEEFEDTQAWVIQHMARPVLKIEQKTRDGNVVLTSYGFAQALAYMLKEMQFVVWSEQKLFTAYTVARTRFGAEISHYFVILEMETAEKISRTKAKDRKQKQTKRK